MVGDGLRITGLYHYPVKSCAGLALDSARITPYGLERDRHWMVVDGQGGFLTQRRFPAMALIRVGLVTAGLELQAPGMEPLVVAAQNAQRPLDVQVWQDRVQGLDCGDAAAQWLSHYLGLPCRLAALGPELHRPVDPDYDRFDSQVAFSDGYPFLLISEASLADLNSRLETPVPMGRFRPNIVVAGCEPYAEDGWRVLRIGELRLHVVKPCSRCIIPTIDQQTGERGREPMGALLGYRRIGGKVCFGQNLVHETKVGALRLGDRVVVEA